MEYTLENLKIQFFFVRYKHSSLTLSSPSLKVGSNKSARGEFLMSLMFASKAAAYLSGVPCMCSPLGYTPGFIHKHYTRLERLAIAKHSSLFCPLVSDEEKSLITLSPGTNVIKLFTAVSYEFRNKLESLSLTSISRLVQCS